MSNDVMPEKPDQSLESQLKMARPQRAEVKRVPLTPDEDKFLFLILNKAIAAEKAGDLAKAIGFYTDYKNELLKIKGKKEGEKTFELKKQYNEQIDTLKKAGLIEQLPSGEMGFVDINGQPRRIPTYEEILERVEAKKEFVEKKKEQGFTQLLLVPFGMKLSDMAEKAKELILKKHRQGKLKGTNGDELELNEDQPFWLAEEYKGGEVDIGEDSDLVYFPEKYDQENHGGKTKKEIIEKTDGWDIMFIEDLSDLPAEGKGKEVGGRKQLEANKTPEQYLKKMKEDEQYAGESGMTPEAELAYFMHYLQKNNQVIDDWEGSGKVNWNLGGYLKSSGGVCCSSWLRSGRRMRLFWVGSGLPDDFRAVRASVRI